MRKIDILEITNAVKDLCIEANCFLGEDICAAIDKALETESSPLGREILSELIENAHLAKEGLVPICQDTGMAVIFIELGQDVSVAGGNLTDAINKGVREGYAEGFLRKSVVAHPFLRQNTNDNTPAIIHYNIVSGDKIKITVAPKGFGSENMSRIYMLKPSDGIDGIKAAVLKTVDEAGPNPCPPVIVGVGIGGNFEKCAYLAKRALLRPIGEYSKDPETAKLEEELLQQINTLGIGPMGLGGNTTALWVAAEIFPTHIAGLPVAVNISCHVTRHKERIL